MQLFFASVILLLILQATASESSCDERSQLKDTIKHRYTVDTDYGFYRKCWKILNPSKQRITLKAEQLNFYRVFCDSANVTVSVDDKVYTLCDSKRYTNEDIIGNTDVLVNFIADKSKYYGGYVLTVQLSYEIEAFQASCEELSESKHTVFFVISGSEPRSKCWKILNPLRLPVSLKGDDWGLALTLCGIIDVTVTANNKTYRVCDKDSPKVIVGTDVLVNYTLHESPFADNLGFYLEFSYEIGILGLPHAKEARSRLIDWLKNERTSEWGWKENTAKAIVALYLGDGATFNGTSLDEELIAKELQVRTAISLLEKPILIERLSMFINALLVTCRNPRHFYGQNLVRILKEQVMSTENFTHPMAYLTLCNANEAWPSKAFEDLSGILNSEYKYPFVRDFQAIVVLAISCYRSNNNSSDEFVNGAFRLDYERTVKELEEQQLSDGSFGTIQSTALISQALITSVTVNKTSWDSIATFEYLMKQLNSSSVDFSSVLFSLPLLNGKTLADIAKVNCSSERRDEDETDVDVFGPKMRIQYSLYIGEDKDVVYTSTLRVPENFTANSVMKLAAAKDPKYKFEFQRIHKDVYIYRIGSLSNDSVDGKFWFQYLKSSDEADPSYVLTALDQLVLKDGDHFIMWYRRPNM